MPQADAGNRMRAPTYDSDDRTTSGPIDLVLAIDLGSSSVRAIAYRTNGERLQEAAEFRPTEQEADGTFDIHILTSLTEQVVSGCLQRVRSLPADYRFIAVSWTSFAMSWLGVDQEMQPVTPIFTYADTRSGAFAESLRQEFTRQGISESTWQRTGAPVHTAYAPAQLLRLAAEEPERLGRVQYWQTLAAYLLARWQGLSPGPISSSEVGWTGLLNRGALSWDGTLVRRVGIAPRMLPPVFDYAKFAVGLASPWSALWPELAKTPFFLAVGDGVGANIGSGCIDHRRIALTIGTTGAMRVVVPAKIESRQGAGQEHSLPQTPGGLWSYPVDSDRWLVGGALTDGGSLSAWLRELFAVQDRSALLAAAAQLPADAHGLTILPFLRGERAPGWANEATLTISGMKTATTPTDIVRAAMEAVALRFRLIFDRLRPLVAPDSEVVASGGALQDNALWRQILADVLQRPVHLVNVDEATSRGAALLALEALGLPLPPPPPTVHRTMPSPDAGPRYEKALLRQEILYRKVVGLS